MGGGRRVGWVCVCVCVCGGGVVSKSRYKSQGNRSPSYIKEAGIAQWLEHRTRD